MIVTQVLAQLLTRSSYKVTIALNGQQGIELFRAAPTDLAIVDVFMPEVDGIEVIRTLKSRKSRNSVHRHFGGRHPRRRGSPARSARSRGQLYFWQAHRQ